MAGGSRTHAKCPTVGSAGSGWYRLAPLDCSLYVPLVIDPAFALHGLWPNYAIGGRGVFWLLNGVAQLAEGNRQS